MVHTFTRFAVTTLLVLVSFAACSKDKEGDRFAASGIQTKAEVDISGSWTGTRSSPIDGDSTVAVNFAQIGPEAAGTILPEGFRFQGDLEQKKIIGTFSKKDSAGCFRVFHFQGDVTAVEDGSRKMAAKYNAPAECGNPMTYGIMQLSLPAPSQIPNSPTGVYAAAGDAATQIQWLHVPGATSYNIYWATQANVTTATGNAIVSAVVTADTLDYYYKYDHLGLLNGTTYYYLVTAVNSAGEGPVSFTVSATPQSSAGPKLPWVTMPAAPFLGKEEHTAIWTGSSMIVWGGKNGDYQYNSGAAYDPASDTWQLLSKTGAPSARKAHTAVWTGTEMIVWGGEYQGTLYNTGGRYNPVSDTWLPTSTINAPSHRSYHAAVWTGSEMIVWGGYAQAGQTNTGAIYDPQNDTWRQMSTVGAPEGRDSFSAVWTGTEMIVWGGYDGQNVLASGSRYNPVSDTWTPISSTNEPGGRAYHSTIWTGTEMIVWGGFNDQEFKLNTGGRYNPATDTWTATSTAGLDYYGGHQHTAVWTGTEMIVYGGLGRLLNVSFLGARYNPDSDTWQFLPGENALRKQGHSAVWTGTEMIVWGGQYNMEDYSANGRRYTPAHLAAPAAPSSPSNLGTSGGYGATRLSWSPVAGASSYNLYWSTTPGVTKVNGTRISNVTSPFSHAGRDFGTTYYYVVTAVGEGGESPESGEMTATPAAPAVPSAPAGVSAAGDSQAVISWSPVTGTAYYNIYWSTTSGVTISNGTKIADATSPYVHQPLTNGTTYYYIVTAVANGIESPASAQVSAAVALESYSLRGDFSASNNPNGVWSYGWSTSLVSGFTLYNTPASDSQGDFWYTSPNPDPFKTPLLGTNFSLDTILNLHPGPQGQASILRWTAPAAGTYTINVIFSGTGSTTTDVHVMWNATAIFAGSVLNTTYQAFSQDQTVSAGDTIDFTVGYGSNMNYTSDSTVVSGTITRVP